MPDPDKLPSLADLNAKTKPQNSLPSLGDLNAGLKKKVPTAGSVESQDLSQGVQGGTLTEELVGSTSDLEPSTSASQGNGIDAAISWMPDWMKQQAKKAAPQVPVQQAQQPIVPVSELGETLPPVIEGTPPVIQSGMGASVGRGAPVGMGNVSQLPAEELKDINKFVENLPEVGAPLNFEADIISTLDAEDKALAESSTRTPGSKSTDKGEVGLKGSITTHAPQKFGGYDIKFTNGDGLKGKIYEDRVTQERENDRYVKSLNTLLTNDEKSLISSSSLRFQDRFFGNIDDIDKFNSEAPKLMKEIEASLPDGMTSKEKERVVHGIATRTQARYEKRKGELEKDAKMRDLAEKSDYYRIKADPNAGRAFKGDTYSGDKLYPNISSKDLNELIAWDEDRETKREGYIYEKKKINYAGQESFTKAIDNAANEMYTDSELQEKTLNKRLNDLYDSKGSKQDIENAERVLRNFRNSKGIGSDKYYDPATNKRIGIEDASPAIVEWNKKIDASALELSQDNTEEDLNLMKQRAYSEMKSLEDKRVSIINKSSIERYEERHQAAKARFLSVSKSLDLNKSITSVERNAWERIWEGFVEGAGIDYASEEDDVLALHETSNYFGVQTTKEEGERAEQRFVDKLASAGGTTTSAAIKIMGATALTRGTGAPAAFSSMTARLATTFAKGEKSAKLLNGISRVVSNAAITEANYQLTGESGGAGEALGGELGTQLSSNLAFLGNSKGGRILRTLFSTTGRAAGETLEEASGKAWTELMKDQTWSEALDGFIGDEPGEELAITFIMGGIFASTKLGTDWKNSKIVKDYATSIRRSDSKGPAMTEAKAFVEELYGDLEEKTIQSLEKDLEGEFVSKDAKKEIQGEIDKLKEKVSERKKVEFKGEDLLEDKGSEDGEGGGNIVNIKEVEGELSNYTVDGKVRSDKQVIENLSDPEFVEKVKSGKANLDIENPSPEVKTALEGSGLLETKQDVKEEITPETKVDETPVEGEQQATESVEKEFIEKEEGERSLKGDKVSTGKPIRVEYNKNLEKAPDMGSQFGQDIEASGDYITQSEGFTPEGFETGSVEIKNPLVVEINEDAETTYKEDLSAKYDGKTGEELSEAIKADGYDAIVSKYADDGSTGEIVLLDNQRTKTKQDAKIKETKVDETKVEETKVLEKSGIKVNNKELTFTEVIEADKARIKQLQKEKTKGEPAAETSARADEIKFLDSRIKRFEAKVEPVADVPKTGTTNLTQAISDSKVGEAGILTNDQKVFESIKEVSKDVSEETGLTGKKLINEVAKRVNEVSEGRIETEDVVDLGNEILPKKVKETKVKAEAKPEPTKQAPKTKKEALETIKPKPRTKKEALEAIKPKKKGSVKAKDIGGGQKTSTFKNGKRVAGDVISDTEFEQKQGDLGGYTKRGKDFDSGGVFGVSPESQFKLNQGGDFGRVHVLLNEKDALEFRKKGSKVNEEVKKLAREERSDESEVVLDLRNRDVAKTKGPKVFKKQNAGEVDKLTKEAKTSRQKTALGTVKNIIKALGSINPDLEVLVHETEDSYLEAMGKEAKGTSGALATDGKIHLNLSRIKDNTALHEAAHVVIAAHMKANPKAVTEFKKQLEGILPKSDLESLNEFANEYEVDGKETVADEFVTEALSRIANGEISLNKTILEKIKEFLRKLAKSLGMVPNQIKLTGKEDVVRFAEKLSEAFQEGRIIDIASNSEAKLLNSDPYSNGERGYVDLDTEFKPKYKKEKEKLGDYSNVDFAKKIPVKSLKEIVKKYEGRVFFITSDATGLGYDSNGDKILGGIGYLGIDENVNEDIGFASVDEKTAKGTVGTMYNRFGGGKPIAVMVMVQAPSSTLGNYYGSKFFGRGLKQIKASNEQEYSDALDSIKEFIVKNKAVNKALKKNKTTDALISLFENIDDYSEVEFAKEFIKDTSFDVRREMLNSLFVDNENIATDKSTPSVKVSLKKLGFNKTEFLNEYGDSKLEPLFKNDEAGYLAGGFELTLPVNRDGLKDLISDTNDKGVTHDQFNGKLPKTGESFYLDGLYHAQDNFKGFAKPNTEITSDPELRAKADKLVRSTFKKDTDYNAIYRKGGEKAVAKSKRGYKHLASPKKSIFKNEILAKKIPEALSEKTPSIPADVARGMGFSPKEGVESDLMNAEFTSAKFQKAKPTVTNPAEHKIEGGKVKFQKTPKEKKLFREPNQDIINVSEEYKKSKGINKPAAKKIFELDVENSKSIADAYEAMENNPSDPKVKKAYTALANEVTEQFNALIEAGYKVELYKGKGEPYANSSEMLQDLRDNKRLKSLSTESDFGKEGIGVKIKADNPMLADSGLKDVNGKSLLVNDLFRFVHDVFGHGEQGTSFGAIGEENAWNVHSKLFSDDARRALTTETRGQNSWVNFGPQMRNADGSVMQKGDPGYLSPMERPFADQKNGLLPDSMVFEEKPKFQKSTSEDIEATKDYISQLNETPFLSGITSEEILKEMTDAGYDVDLETVNKLRNEALEVKSKAEPTKTKKTPKTVMGRFIQSGLTEEEANRLAGMAEKRPTTNKARLNIIDKIIQEFGVDKAYELTSDPKTNSSFEKETIEYFAVAKVSSLKKQAAKAESVKERDKLINQAAQIQTELATEAERAGQITQFKNVIYDRFPEMRISDTVVDTINKKTAEELSAPSGVQGMTVGEEIEGIRTAIEEEIKKEVEKEIEGLKEQVRKLKEEKAGESQKKKGRKQISDALAEVKKLASKKTPSGPASAGIPGLSPDMVNAIAKLVAGYVNVGIGSIKAIVDKVMKDLKSAGIKVNKSDIEKIADANPELSKIAEIKAKEEEAKAKAKEQESKLQETIEDFYINGNSGKTSLAEHMADKLGMTTKQAQGILDETGLESKIQKKVKETANKELDKNLKKSDDLTLEEKAERKKQQAENNKIVNKVSKTIRLGGLAGRDFTNDFADKYGFATVTAEQMALLEQLVLDADRFEESGQRELHQKTQRRINTEIRKMKPKDAAFYGKLAMELAYLNALSGLNTQGNANIGALSTSSIHLMGKSLEQLARGKIGAVSYGFRAMRKSLKAASKAATEARRFNYSKFQSHNSYMEGATNQELGIVESEVLKGFGHYLSKVKSSESAKENTKNIFKAIGSTLLQYSRMNFLLNASDAFLTTQFSEFNNAIEVYNKEIKEAGISGGIKKTINRKDLIKTLDEAMGYDQNSRFEKEVDQEIEAEKLKIDEEVDKLFLSPAKARAEKKRRRELTISKGYKARRVQELMIQERDQEIYAEAVKTARDWIMLSDPDGVLGALNESLKRSIDLDARKDPTVLRTIGSVFTGLTIMFSRMTAKTANAVMTSIPVIGLIPATIGWSKNKEGKWTKMPGLKPKADMLLFKRRVVANMLMTAAGGVIFSEMFEWDDDDEEWKLDPNRLVDFTFGTKGDEQAIKGATWGVGFSFRNSPDEEFGPYRTLKYAPQTLPITAAIGYFADQSKGLGTKSQLEAFDKAKKSYTGIISGTSLSVSFTQMLEGSFNSIGRSVKKITQSKADNAGEKVAEAAFDLTTSPLKTITQPNFYRDLINEAGGRGDVKKAYPDSYFGRLKYDYYGLDAEAENKTDIFGYEYKTQGKLSQWVNGAMNDNYDKPEWKILLKYPQVSIPIFKANEDMSLGGATFRLENEEMVEEYGDFQKLALRGLLSDTETLKGLNEIPELIKESLGEMSPETLSEIKNLDKLPPEILQKVLDKLYPVSVVIAKASMLDKYSDEIGTKIKIIK